MFRSVQSNWQAAILVCGKCTRRIGGGFGKKGKSSLARKLRELGNGRKGRKADIGVVETGCLKLCPRNAVVAFNAARPRDWIVIRAGADIEEAAVRLGLR